MGVSLGDDNASEYGGKTYPGHRTYFFSKENPGEHGTYDGFEQ